MKKKTGNISATLFLVLLIMFPFTVTGQSQKAVVKKYLSELPKIKKAASMQKYRMTATYINRDLYGKFTGKTRVSGDCTTGLPGDSIIWQNVYISNANSFAGPFPEGKKQEYIENFKYYPSFKMLEKNAFAKFPSSPESVFARNLIWDLLTFDTYAWNFYDSLKLNVPYIIPGIKGEFKMADLGSYSHNTVILCWQGITELNGEMCALISFNAIDNGLELDMDMIKSKGTEQYWGSILLSMKSGNIEKAEMYSGTMQEITVKGMQDKILTKTIRELKLDKIQ